VIVGLTLLRYYLFADVYASSPSSDKKKTVFLSPMTCAEMYVKRKIIQNRATVMSGIRSTGGLYKW
jgi:hypothetical protein